MSDTKNDNVFGDEDFQFKLLLALFAVTAAALLLRPPLYTFTQHVFGADVEVAQYPALPQQPAATLGAYGAMRGPQPFPAIWQRPDNPALAMVDLSQQLFDLLNGERKSAGLQQLHRDSQLDLIAYRHSKDMYQRGYFDHVSPDGFGPAYRVAMQHRSFFGLPRENVAVIGNTSKDYTALATEFNTGWMNSPGHRRNMLHKPAKVAGIGCFEGTGDKGLNMRYCTQLIAELTAYTTTDIEYEYAQDATLRLTLTDLAQGGERVLALQEKVAGVFHSDTKLQSSGDRYQGDFYILGPANTYQVMLKLQDPNNALRYSVVPGPIISKLN